MTGFAVFFREEQDGFIPVIVQDGSPWENAQHIPRIGDDIYLGGLGKRYWWYTVKAVRWFDSQSATVVVHNRREQVAE